jgi:hypothetical protein
MNSSPTVEGTSALAVAPAMETAIAVADPEPIEASQPPRELSLPKIQTATLSAMERTAQKIIANWLEMGEWKIDGADVIVSVNAKQPMIDAAIKGEAQRVLNDAASEASGQAVRVRLIPGVINGNGANVAKPVAADGSDAKSRAMNDPIVKKMREKFGTEIRTVVDQRKR